jgi:hypothetical protein
MWNVNASLDKHRSPWYTCATETRKHMAEMHDTFAANIDCPDEEKANALLSAIEDMLQEADENEYTERPENLFVEDLRDKWYVYISGYNGLSDRIPPIIHEHLAKWDADTKVIISGSYGCSKLRPDHFGGWACGITKSHVEWIVAVDEMRKRIEG